MSQLAQVAEIAGVSTADVVRVATRGGTTAADWDIAYAIARVTNQDPYRFMLFAGRDEEVAEIWADSREPEPAPAPTPQPQAEAETDRRPGAAQWRELLHTRIWPDIAGITRAAAPVIERIVSGWNSARAALEGFTDLLARQAGVRDLRTALGLTHQQARDLLATYVTTA